MKKIFVGFAFFIGMHVSNAMLVQLPNAEILRNRLSNNKFNHLVTTTDIVDQLAGKNKSVIELILSVELILAAYERVLNNPTRACVIENHKRELLELVLYGSREDALIELRTILAAIAD